MKKLARALPAGLLLLCANAQAALPPAPPSGLDQLADTGSCDSIIAGGGSVKWTLEPGCLKCTVADAAKGADSNRDTTATLTMGPSVNRTGGASIRATAPAGVIYPAGTRAYILELDPALPKILTAFTENYRTLLNGLVQDELSVSLPVGIRSEPDFVVPIQATKPYNAIEFRVIVNGNPQSLTWRVRELCNNVYGEIP